MQIGKVASLGVWCGAGERVGGLGPQRDWRDESHLTNALFDGVGPCGLRGWVRWRVIEVASRAGFVIGGWGIG